MKELLLSVIIPTKDEEDYILPTLKRLAEQTYQNFELIVKDGLSTDRTAEIAKEYADLVISSKDISIGDARNQGAGRAKGDVLIFLDADTSLEKHALELIAEDFVRYDIVLLITKYGIRTGDVNVSKTKKQAMRFFVGIQNFWRNHVDKYGCGMLLPVDSFTFRKIGGFNPRVKCCEDVEISYRLRKVGNVLNDYRIMAHFSIRRFQYGGFIKTIYDYAVHAIRMHLKLSQPQFEIYR
ncbi:glycosyltransferase [Candidatus Bathyarchaeota archaeon]|nr:glycosyltransferase [Candidatus Bathyarchaeota archaeon]